jgi:hypothetical protein
MTQLIPTHNFTLETHQKIANANPLNANEQMKLLAIYNEMTKKSEITALFRRLLPNLQTVVEADFYDKMAIMRDLGMFLGSLKRHNIEPLQVVPEAEPILLQIANDTDMPPRDTLLHYSVWNPANENMRLYTTSFREAEIVKSLQLATPPLEKALHALDNLYNTHITNADFAKYCEIVTDELEFLIDAIVAVYRKVPPLYFLEDLRPYYEPVMIAGKPYGGPGAVEIPLFLVDHALWASENDRPEYLDMKERGLGNVLPHWRTMYFNLKGKPAIVTTVMENLKDANYEAETAAIVRKNVIALDKIFTQLISFRLPHLKIADISYGNNNPKFGKDKKGFGKSILAIILDMMKEKRQQLTEISQKVRNMA